MATLILFNKPFRVLSQFTDDDGRTTLADFIRRPDVYAAGRLDYDSEGLLLLTDDGHLQQRIADPRFKLEKTYWVQVEGEISDEALSQLRSGVQLKDGLTRPAKARRLAPPQLWERIPPIRQRANIPTSWVELKIKEGRNRQVRRMTAGVGFPTLRLVRVAIGEWRLDDLAPGEHKTLTLNLPPATTGATSSGKAPAGAHKPKPRSQSTQRRTKPAARGTKSASHGPSRPRKRPR